MLTGCSRKYLLPSLSRLHFAADSTGTHSLYTMYQDYEVMFHVSTMLPYTPNNRQQVSEHKLNMADERASDMHAC